jgi:hypothetical protein
MTQAKRYQGERLRAEQWHNMGRGKAWEMKRAGMCELEKIVKGKFDLYCEAQYDPVDCGYLVVLEVSTKVPQYTPGIRVHRPEQLVFTHKEPALEFPSDHLKTKLLMIAG